MTKTLGDVFEIGSGGTPSKKHAEYYGGSVPWVKTGDLKSEYIYSVEECITEDGLSNSSAKMYEPDTVLIAMYGATIGATSILKIPACTNQACAAFKPNDNVRPEYLFYFLTSKRAQFIKDGVGGAQPNISAGYLKKVPFNLIDLKKQDQIIRGLNKTMNIINNRKAKLNILDELIKARFVEMFGDTENNSKSFSEMKLGDICDLQNGYAFKSEDYVELSSVNNCRMSNIRPDGGFDPDYSPKYLPEEYWDYYSAYRLYNGDVIIAMTDMASDPKILGVPTIVNSNGKKFLLNQRVGKLVFAEDEQFNRVFLMRFLGQKYIRMNLAKKAGGSTQINIGKPAILDIEIVRPPIESQNQFADFVKQVDKTKVAIQKSLDETQQLFDSLMQEHFG